jgi:hypothetical protein
MSERCEKSEILEEKCEEELEELEGEVTTL